jgi:adenosine/AMP kinase
MWDSIRNDFAVSIFQVSKMKLAICMVLKMFENYSRVICKSSVLEQSILHSFDKPLALSVENNSQIARSYSD